jgi:hypothetical protein
MIEVSKANLTVTGGKETRAGTARADWRASAETARETAGTFVSSAFGSRTGSRQTTALTAPHEAKGHDSFGQLDPARHSGQGCFASAVAQYAAAHLSLDATFGDCTATSPKRNRAAHVAGWTDQPSLGSSRRAWPKVRHPSTAVPMADAQPGADATISMWMTTSAPTVLVAAHSPDPTP